MKARTCVFFVGAALVDAATGGMEERNICDAHAKVGTLNGSSGSQTEWATDADQNADMDNEILYRGYR